MALISPRAPTTTTTAVLFRLCSNRITRTTPPRLMPPPPHRRLAPHHHSRPPPPSLSLGCRRNYCSPDNGRGGGGGVIRSFSFGRTTAASAASSSSSSSEGSSSSSSSSAHLDGTGDAADDNRRPKVCLVVGAGDAIGSAIARRFSQGGYVAAVARRNGRMLRRTVEEIESAGGTCVPLECDARDEDSVIQMFGKVEEDCGPIDVCVFNIGANISFPIRDTTARKFYKCWEMSCYSGFLTGREAARHMTPRGRGTIIFTGATASRRGAANFAAFAVAKTGLRALAQSMARELGPHGVHVAHVVIDGAVDTPWIRRNFAPLIDKLPKDGIIQPEAIAESYWALSQQPRCAWTHELDIRPFCEKF